VFFRLPRRLPLSFFSCPYPSLFLCMTTIVLHFLSSPHPLWDSPLPCVGLPFLQGTPPPAFEVSGVNLLADPSRFWRFSCVCRLVGNVKTLPFLLFSAACYPLDNFSFFPFFPMPLHLFFRFSPCSNLSLCQLTIAFPLRTGFSRLTKTFGLSPLIVGPSGEPDVFLSYTPSDFTMALSSLCRVALLLLCLVPSTQLNSGPPERNQRPRCGDVSFVVLYLPFRFILRFFSFLRDPPHP